jgi:isoleucyl-tRNA synthetase
MKVVRQIVEKGHSARKVAEIKLRQPLAAISYKAKEQLGEELEKLIAEEVNVKSVQFKKGIELDVTLDTKITQDLKEEGEAREVIRKIQQQRKEMGLTLKDKIKVELPEWPEKFTEMIKKSTATESLEIGSEFKIEKI